MAVVWRSCGDRVAIVWRSCGYRAAGNTPAKRTGELDLDSMPLVAREQVVITSIDVRLSPSAMLKAVCVTVTAQQERTNTASQRAAAKVRAWMAKVGQSYDRSIPEEKIPDG